MKNRLTFIKNLDGKKSEYLCQCGKICIKIKNNVGRSTFSCGCLSKELTSLRSKGKTPTNALKDPTESSFNALYSQYKYTSFNKNREFSLTKEQFKSVVTMNCFYCDIEPSQIRKQRDTRQGFFYNVIDRKNNNLGYTLDNCVACCKECNFLKSNRNIDDFLYKIKTIYLNIEKRKLK